MIKYRPNRDSLANALKETKTFDTIDAMFDYLVTTRYTKFLVELFTKNDLSIEDGIWYDDRCNWNTQYVCVSRMGNVIYTCPQCIGMCDLGKQIR